MRFCLVQYLSLAATLCSLLGSVPHVAADVVEFGACLLERTNEQRCARNSTFCTDEEIWLTPHARHSAIDGLALCACATTPIGSCSAVHGHRSQCTTERASCDNPDSDEYRDSHRYGNDGAHCLCTGLEEHEDSTNEIEFEQSQYGACVEETGDYYCVMHSHMCTPSDTFISPSQLKKSRGSGAVCTCANTKMGACYHPLGTNCAVDGDSCETGDIFLKPKETIERGLDCSLCSATDLTAAKNMLDTQKDDSSSSGTQAGSSNPSSGSEGVANILDPSPSNSNGASGETKYKKAVIALGILAGVLFIMNIAILSHQWRFLARNKAMKDIDSEAEATHEDMESSGENKLPEPISA